ncbi:GNAT family N-acetyltransferase [Streptomyces chartreusis]|uniref:GNAT family N-acetyltransferase n=1 Tax=Streptomyces TaxID=1883 RepID=UPI000897079B|nr:GNAT family N-acetyltransferase [Streptomyces sp. PAN_FS17]SED29304.1 Protein N-acetyltransferase, RimJ/RimL family [Streptomyces sp. PAN_FS17]
MPPTDASANAGAAPVTDTGTTSPTARESRIGPAADAGADSEDTLDLHLPDEFVALFAEDTGTDGKRSLGATATATATATAGQGSASATRAATVEGAGTTTATCASETPPASTAPNPDDLLGDVADWGPVSTPAGALHLVPVRIERDLPIISRWMNDPAVTAFWGLAGPENAIEEHLRSQLLGDGRSVPCMGLLEGTPMSYWEIYRADLDPLARHYPARPHDTGVHLLIGGMSDRGRGLGGTLLRAVADLVLDKRPACARVVAEPDIRNTPSVAVFLTAGFRFSAEIDLPAKRAALMIRDRSLRHLL